MACSYCTAANMGRVHGDGDVGEIVDEIAALVASARLKGLPVLPLFLAADEVNLPDERLLVRVLASSWRATLRSRALARLLQPDTVQRRALRADRGDERQVSMTVDSACDDVLARTASRSGGGTSTRPSSGPSDTGSRSSSD